jgi:hypothetical protein
MGMVGRSSVGPSAARRHAVVVVAILTSIAFGLSACGSSSPTSGSSASSPESALLESSDFSRYPKGSVQRTFFEYWSDMQYRSWANVASYYDPRFRDFVGTASIIGAKKLNGSSYPVLRPELVRVRPSREATTVYYTLRLEDGTKELDSTSWRRDDGAWQIVYDSRLDSELDQLATNRVELEETGAVATDASQPISSKAAKSGITASQLQARFLEQELKISAP